MPVDGLAALEGDGQDLFLALARRLIQATASEEPALDAVLAETRAIQKEADDYLIEEEWGTEVISATTPVLPQRLPDGDMSDLWQRVFSGELRPEQAVRDAALSSGNGRVVSFEELARLVQRPKQRRRPAPEGQFALFER